MRIPSCYHSEQEHVKDAEIRGIFRLILAENPRKRRSKEARENLNLAPDEAGRPRSFPQRRRNRGWSLEVDTTGSGALTMLRRQEAEEASEEADAASVASSRMAGQSRSKTRWLR
jgi:hypothetical protein